MGKLYRVEYTRDMVQTDVDKRNALWGQVDFHTRTIRVYIGKGDRKRQPADLFETLLHEVIHAIMSDNQLLKDSLKDSVEEAFTDNLGNVLADTLLRNKLVTYEFP